VAQVIDNQRQLRVPRGREHETFEEGGKSLHAAGYSDAVRAGEDRNCALRIYFLLTITNKDKLQRIPNKVCRNLADLAIA
jgi:hypothetical protein